MLRHLMADEGEELPPEAFDEPRHVDSWPPDGTEFNIHGFPKYHHVLEYPPVGEVRQVGRSFCPSRSAGFFNPLTRKIVFVRPACVRPSVRLYPISLL